METIKCNQMNEFMPNGNKGGNFAYFSLKILLFLFFQLPDSNMWVSEVLSVAAFVVDMLNNMLVVKEITMTQNLTITDETHINDPRCKKTCLRGFRSGQTQIGLCNHRRNLDARNFDFRNLYFLCSENKGADLRLCFRKCKNPVFS